MFAWLQRLFGTIDGFNARSPEWPRVRAEHLTRQPTCESCGSSRDLEVHHLVPVQYAPELELDPLNLLTLCGEGSHGCHHRCGHSFDWKAFNPNAVSDAASQRRRIEQRRYSR